MAQRRMFSLTIIDSDEFLEMPPTARLLYFDLGMRADDDGFIQPTKIMRLTNANVDDLRVLISKKFVIPFNEGKVLVIADWKINNFIRQDRYAQTIFIEYKKLLNEEETGRYTIGIPNVIPEVDPGKDRIGKVRVGKDRVELGEVKESSRFAPPSLDEVSEYITHNGYSVDPEAWYAFYESNGWKVGKNKMVSWKGAVATWEKRNAPKLDDYQKAMKVLEIIKYENGKPNKAYLKKVWNGIDLAAIKVALESFYPDQMELLPRETSLVIQNLDVIKKHLC